MTDEKYTQQLEATIAKFLSPVRDVPFPIAIKAITGFKVLSLSKENEHHQQLLNQLSKAMHLALQKANQDGISGIRANEVGNNIEPIVRKAINQIGLKAEIPQTASGKHKIAGYPDICIMGSRGILAYLECKTYNPKNIDSGFRTFYFQPSTNPKTTQDALHLMAIFEIIREIRKGEELFVPVYYKLYSLEKTLFQIKHEFNASNKDIYKPEFVLAEGGLN